MVKDEIWIRFSRKNPEEIIYFFIPEIRKEKYKKKVYGRILYHENPKLIGKLSIPNRLYSRKLETWEIVKYRLTGELPTYDA